MVKEDGKATGAKLGEINGRVEEIKEELEKLLA